jgi:hypothetical protein
LVGKGRISIAAVDIYETENELVIKADLPEVNPRDLDIRLVLVAVPTLVYSLGSNLFSGGTLFLCEVEIST